ncbi:hypothetical protein HU200_033229 [Digitaria exilis]|uniref:ABC transporter domain-containing protein n=1 Tax=Digitaria exilis TaxID=1010633 RepID=A0A835BXI1_9POAL|nr:hypothetical protein HU200_033229 [Digitaria exilis]
MAAFPVLVCGLLFVMQTVVDSELGRAPFRCGCVCARRDDGYTGACVRWECGIQHSTLLQAPSCGVRTPQRWPALVQVPDAEARAMTRRHTRPCNASENCPATVLLTGRNRQLAQEHWLVTMGLVPGFSLYRGIYYLAGYAYAGRNMGKPGMQWVDLNDPLNGMKDVLVLMSIEWIILLPVAFLLDQWPTWHPLYLFTFLSVKHSSLPGNKVNGASKTISIDIPMSDAILEHEFVKQLLEQMDTRSMIICHSLKKVYPGKNGNPDKIAVRGLSLALPKGQCFGMLGPSGSGKTSFINMMTGLVRPTYGTAYIDGMDLRNDMSEIYPSIGVCPQHDLLWETLTGREHLMFYGRMKNLTGAALTKELSSQHPNGPFSAHSMEEAEELCDRVGIFIAGSFHCLGTPTELKVRYGGTRTLTISTMPEHAAKVEELVSRLSPGVTRIYSVSGTQKFTLPRREVALSDVLGAVDAARRVFPVLGWGVADATLEDVFVRVAKEAQVLD